MAEASYCRSDTTTLPWTQNVILLQQIHPNLNIFQIAGQTYKKLT